MPHWRHMGCGVIECGVMGTLKAQGGSKGCGWSLGMGDSGVGGTLWEQEWMGTSISQWVQGHGAGDEGCASGARQGQGVLGSA